MNEWEKFKFSESQAKVWDLVEKLTTLYVREEHEEMKTNGSPDQNKLKELRDGIVTLINSFNNEISSYNLEELFAVISFLHAETNTRTLAATHPLVSRTLMEVQKKMKTNENENNVSMGSR